MLTNEERNRLRTIIVHSGVESAFLLRVMREVSVPPQHAAERLQLVAAALQGGAHSSMSNQHIIANAFELAEYALQRLYPPPVRDTGLQGGGYGQQPTKEQQELNARMDGRQGAGWTDEQET